MDESPHTSNASSKATLPSNASCHADEIREMVGQMLRSMRTTPRRRKPVDAAAESARVRERYGISLDARDAVPRGSK